MVGPAPKTYRPAIADTRGDAHSISSNRQIDTLERHSSSVLLRNLVISILLLNPTSAGCRLPSARGSVAPVEWLNYQHLLYFWTVARHGSVAGASSELRLTPQTISGQVRRFEAIQGVRLLKNTGRRMVLTETGKEVFRYADEIFSLGRELLGSLKVPMSPRRAALIVGVADAFPRAFALKLLRPAFEAAGAPQLSCRWEPTAERFFERKREYDPDFVFAEKPLEHPNMSNQLLGESGTSFLVAASVPRQLRASFPRSLNGLPFILPGGGSVARAALDRWFATVKVHPKSVAESTDVALLCALGESGRGVFTVPTASEDDFLRRSGVRVIGRTESVRHQFFLISTGAKGLHPATRAILAQARRLLPKAISAAPD
jgi:LysR family transcriptional regulator, transcriptional activator of nhaA